MWTLREILGQPVCSHAATYRFNFTGFRVLGLGFRARGAEEEQEKCCATYGYGWMQPPSQHSPNAEPIGSNALNMMYNLGTAPPSVTVGYQY